MQHAKTAFNEVAFVDERHERIGSINLQAVREAFNLDVVEVWRSDFVRVLYESWEQFSGEGDGSPSSPQGRVGSGTMRTGFRRLNPAPQLLMLLWDIMSQMPGTAQDNSSQEKQDTRPITTASATGMLLTERRTQVISQHTLMFFYQEGRSICLLHSCSA